MTHPRPPLNDDNLARQIAALSPERQAALRLRLRIDAADGHTLIARGLRALGVERIYTLIGTPMGETIAACHRLGIRALGVRHQQAAVMMAMAENYVRGRMTAVSILSPGPGITNAATGILVAHDNCWPVVVLGARRPLAMRGMGSFQELASVPVLRSMTKHAEVVETTAGIPEAIDRAFSIATSGRPGPVYLEIPEDILTGVSGGSGAAPEGASASHAPDAPADPDSDAIERCVDILLSAERPSIIVGKGVRWSEPYAELRDLVERYGIPFMTAPMGQGCLPDEHPLCFNSIRGFLQSRSDAVLVLGARLDWTFRFGTELAVDAKVIRVDIHAEELGVNVMPTVGIAGDVKRVLEELLKRLDERPDSGGRGERLDLWYTVLDERRRERMRRIEPLMNSDALPMSPHRMMKEIRDFLPANAICVLDGNVSMATAQQVIPSSLPASRLTPGTNGCMGVGIPFGIAAKLAAPDRPVLVICGDSAFGFNGLEMETATRYGVPLIVVVANNDGQSGALTQKALFPSGHEPVAMFGPSIRYERIVETLGGHSEFVDHPRQLRPALERAARSGKPACINVRVDPHAPYPCR